MNPLFFSSFRFCFLYLVLPAFFLLGGQLWWLHLKEAPYLTKRVVEARHHYRELDAKRGTIVDSRGTIFAHSVEVWDVCVDPHALQEEREKEVKRMVRQQYRKKENRKLDAKVCYEAMKQQEAQEYKEKVAAIARILSTPEKPFTSADIEKVFTPTYRRKPIPKADALSAGTAPTPDLPTTPVVEGEDKLPKELPDSPFAVLAYLGRWFCDITGFNEKLFPPVVRKPKEGEIPVTWVKIVEGVSFEKMTELKRLKLRGLQLESKIVRRYPQGPLAAPLIGYVNKPGIPVMGIERSLNWCLEGIRGFILTEKDGLQRELRNRRWDYRAPVSGMRVELTIDSFIQEICEQEAAKVAAEYSPESVAIIVSAPTTGKLLALANWPSFDLARYGDRKISPVAHQKNRALTDIYDPGSVFKIVAVSAALNEGVVDPEEKLDTSQQTVVYFGKKRHMPSGEHRPPEKNILDIVKRSSNRGSVLLAMRLGERTGSDEKFFEYIQKFGFGLQTGLYQYARNPNSEEELKAQEKAAVAATEKRAKEGKEDAARIAAGLPPLHAKAQPAVTAKARNSGSAVKTDKFSKLEAIGKVERRTVSPLDRIAAESRGLVTRPDSKGWNLQTITRVPMGHSISVTPVQMHFAMGVIASGGKLMEPLFVNRIIAPEGTEAEATGRVSTYLQYEPTVRVQVLSPQVAEQVALLLREVVSGDGGTAPDADIPGFDVAGKTGTSQKTIKGPDGVVRYTDKQHVTSFSGFFPVRNPLYVITVVIDDPKLNGKGSGGKHAAPVFRAVARKIIDKFQIHQVTQESGQQLPLPLSLPVEALPGALGAQTTGYNPYLFR